MILRRRLCRQHLGGGSTGRGWLSRFGGAACLHRSGDALPLSNIHIYLGDIFLLATDKILSRYAAGRAGALSFVRGVVPEALAIIYQVPKTCFVVRFYLHEFFANTAA